MRSILDEDTGIYFRALDTEEKAKFKQWARDHHKAGGPIQDIWHPTVREECRRIDREQFSLKQHWNEFVLQMHVGQCLMYCEDDQLGVVVNAAIAGDWHE